MIITDFCHDRHHSTKYLVFFFLIQYSTNIIDYKKMCTRPQSNVAELELAIANARGINAILDTFICLHNLDHTKTYTIRNNNNNQR